MNKTNKPQILIIDKNAGGSFLLMSILRDWGFDTFSVNSFLKAVDYCKTSYTPEIIIVEMQEASSILFDFPQKFHERTGKSIPIVAYSPISDKDIIQKVMRSGFDDYILRPVDPEVLHDKINNLISPEFKLSEKTFNFQLNEQARMIVPITLESINEFGVLANLPFKVPPGSFIDIQCSTFESLGFPEISVKVVDIKTKPIQFNDPNPFQAKFSFVGLSSVEITKLRKVAIFRGATA